MSLAATVVAYAANISQAQVLQSNVKLTKLDHEAQKLLKVVVAAESSPGRCWYGTEWDQPKLDADEKRLAHVGLGFAKPSATGDFRTIINPDHNADVTILCTDAELKSYAAERVAEFEAGSERSMQIDRTLFSYPIFGQSQTKAIVIVTRLALDGRFRMADKIGRHSGGSSVVAQKYGKVGGRWRLLRSHLLGIT